MSVFTPTFDALPMEIPVFPLTGALLLPGRQLPLNIFEQRYLDMTFDALGRDRNIGMIQPDGTTGTSPESLFRIGCMGRISAFNETDDGRLLISLIGVCRFEVEQELEPRRGYRCVRPIWTNFERDSKPVGEFALDKTALQEDLRGYFEAEGMRVDWEAMYRLTDAELVDFLAINLPFAPQEKQALLEAPSHADRASVVSTLVKMVDPNEASLPDVKH